MTYSEKLRSPNWQRKRLEILQRDHFACQLCLDRETELQIHHLEYIRGNEPWQYEGHQLTTLCKNCHCYVSSTAIYPYRIIKKLSGPETFLVIFDANGMHFKYPKDWNLSISQETLKDVVQILINYWLLNEEENILTDRSIS